MACISRLTMVLALFAAPVFAQDSKSGSSTLDGVWKIVDVVRTGEGAFTNSNPRPSLYIFMNKHYSITAWTNFEPSTFAAHAGTFEIQGTTLTGRPVVAENEALIVGPAWTRDFEIDGDTLWLLSRSAPGQQPAFEAKVKLTRVK